MEQGGDFIRICTLWILQKHMIITKRANMTVDTSITGAKADHKKMYDWDNVHKCIEN